MDSRLISLVAAAVSVVAWGTGDYVAALAARRLRAFRTLAWNAILSTAGAIALALVAPRAILIPLQGVVRIAAVQVISMAGTLAFYRGLEVGRVSFVAPLSGGWALVTLLLAVLLYGEAPSPLQILGGAGIVAGVLTAAIDWRLLRSKFRLGAADPALPWVGLTTIGWGVSAALYSRLSIAYGWVAVSVWVWIVNALLMLLVSLAGRRSLRLESGETVAWSTLIVLAGVNVIGTASYGLAFQHGLASVVAPLSSMHPLVAILLGYLLLHERLSAPQRLGVVLALGGLLALALGG